MKTLLFTALIMTFFLILINPAVGQETTTAFINATILSLDQEDAIPLQTVIITGGRIDAIGPVSDIAIPSGATVIDAAGAYLVPGLTDAHVHLDNKIGARPDFGDAPLYLANGVTTVFNMRGEAEHLDWKKRIADGSLLAPNLYTAGEFVNEPRINTPEEAEQEVEHHRRDGYDIIKYREVIDFENYQVLTTTGLGKPAYLRLNQAARQAAIPLIGHAPYNHGLSGLLEARQSLAHLNELSNLYFLPPLELNQGFFIHLTKWSLVLLAVCIALWFLVTVLSRGRYRTDVQRSSQPERFRNITILLILFSAIGLLLWILVVPPGFFFGNIGLLVLLSCLTLLVLVLALSGVILAIKIWQELPQPLYLKFWVTWLLFISVVLSVGLAHWTVFAWRGSDYIVNRVARECKEAGIWVQSTLICQETFMGQKDGFRGLQVVADPFFRYLPASMQETWQGFLEYQLPRTISLWKRLPEFNQRLIRALHDAGVPLMAGTDAMGIPLVIPGISLHQELRLLRECGLPARDVLWAATVGPARFLGKEDEFGTITVGKRADLLLLEGNPLDDLARLRRLKGVMVRGQWLPKDKLDQMLAEMLIEN